MGCVYSASRRDVNCRSQTTDRQIVFSKMATQDLSSNTFFEQRNAGIPPPSNRQALCSLHLYLLSQVFTSFLVRLPLMMLYCNLIEIREAIFPMSACREKRDGGLCQWRTGMRAAAGTNHPRAQVRQRPEVEYRNP